MVKPVLVLLFEHQEWHELVVIDVSDPAGRVANRDVSQAFVELGMGGLDDSEGIRGDIFERIVPNVH